MADQHRAGKHVIDGNVEEALNLRGVQVDEESAVGAGGGEQIGDELGADGDAGTVLAILSRVSVIGNDGGDAGGGGALECVDHDKKLHQVLVDGIAGGLDDEDVDAADVLEQLEVDFAIGEALQLDLTDRNADVAADLFGQGPIGRAAEELEAPVLAEIASPLALGCRFGILRLRVRVLAGVGLLVGVARAGCLLVFQCYLSPFPLPSSIPPSWLALAAFWFLQIESWLGD